MVLVAIRAGLAENVRVGDNLLSPTSVEFDLPGGLTVYVCCERRSLQCYDSAAHTREVLGGERRGRRVLAELTSQGWVDTANNETAWASLKRAIETVLS
jgi:hypothetical protein